MARKRRGDAKGADFHVFDRGRGKSPIFLDRHDYLFFLDRLADAVRREEILVLSFVLMTNHFHLLLRSLGALSRAMQRIKSEYVREFNRRYGCDGALTRARFGSKPVRNPWYRRNVVLYQDENPLTTEPPLAERPEDYEWSSAYYFARPGLLPWLSRAGIKEAGLEYGRGTTHTSTADVRRVRKWFIETRLRHGEDGTEALGHLLSRDPARIHTWLLNETDPSHEGGPSLPVACPELVVAEVKEAIERTRVTAIAVPGARPVSAERLLCAGLLGDLAAQNDGQIAPQVQRCRTTVKRLYKLHGQALRESSTYADLACDVVMACVEPLKL